MKLFHVLASVESFMPQLRLCSKMMDEEETGTDQVLARVFRVHCSSPGSINLCDVYAGAKGIGSKVLEKNII